MRDVPACVSKELLDLLLDAFAATDMRYVQSTRSKGASDAFEMLRFLVKGQLDDGPNVVRPLPRTSEGRVMEACRLAATIHLRAVAHLIPHSDPVNEPELKRLRDILWLLKMTDCMHIPYVYLWM